MSTVSVYLGDELREKIDERRGDQSRSSWVRNALEEQLDEPSDDDRLDDLERRLDLLREEALSGRVRSAPSWAEIEEGQEGDWRRPF